MIVWEILEELKINCLKISIKDVLYFRGLIPNGPKGYAPWVQSPKEEVGLGVKIKDSLMLRTI